MTCVTCNSYACFVFHWPEIKVGIVGPHVGPMVTSTREGHHSRCIGSNLIAVADCCVASKTKTRSNSMVRR